MSENVANRQQKTKHTTHILKTKKVRLPVFYPIDSMNFNTASLDEKSSGDSCRNLSYTVFCPVFQNLFSLESLAAKGKFIALDLLQMAYKWLK